MRRTRLFLNVAVVLSLILFPLLTKLSVLADSDGKPAGELLPTGKRITPTAAKGSVFQKLNPDLAGHPDFVAGQAVTTAISPDGNTLLILTSGYNSQNDANGKTDPAQSNEYIFVYNIAGHTPVKMQVLQIPNAFDGLAWNPSGQEFYASGGTSDNVHVFGKTQNAWTESGAPIALGHGKALGLGNITPGAAGLAVTSDGKRLLVANYENDSISVVDLKTRTKTAELDLRPGSAIAGGEYPFWVAIKGNGTAFVSSARDREIVVIDISAAAPTVVGRIPVKGQPTKMILNQDQSLLFAALSSSDSVVVIDTKSQHVLGTFNTTAPKSVLGHKTRFRGANPNSLALSPDERTLYVTNGGANSVAVVRLGQNFNGSGNTSVEGLIPTGWYPNSVSVSHDGSTLYVVNGKSNTGPVPGACRNNLRNDSHADDQCNAANQYVWQLTKAGFLALPTPGRGELEDLTEQVARNNDYRGDAHGESEELMAHLRKQIQHVIYIVKENRTYDQVLGDLNRGNGDPALAIFPQPLTPNFHKLATQFVDLDNFYDSGEVSGDGWNWSTSARAADTIEKTEPINYAGRGLNYDYEGANRNINTGLATLAQRLAANPVTPNDPNLLPGTNDVSEPEAPEGESGAGYLWDSALRAGKSVRNYGFFNDLTRYSPAVGPAQIPLERDPFSKGILVSFPTKAALQSITDQYYRGYDNAFPDFYRVNEWEREFRIFEENGNLPNLELVRLMHDHFGSFGTAIDGVNTIETQIADNDYAVGRVVDIVSHSDKYKDNTLIFVVEDDSQDGPDHVDAHRSTAFVAGPVVKQGAVVSKHYTTVSMIRTMVDVLGIEPLGLYDATSSPMTDVFTKKAADWKYKAVVPDVLQTTSLVGFQMVRNYIDKTGVLARYSRPLHDAAYWESQTQGLDFSVEDHLDAARFNRILWAGMKGEDVPYPTVRDGRDLRSNRRELLGSSRAKAAMTQTAGGSTRSSTGAVGYD